MKVKQEDIAKRLGISRTTVARALNASGSIKESRRNEILKVAEEMGYKKNTLGSVLATKKNKVIYIFVVKSVNKFYLEEIYKGFEAVEHEYNYLKFKFKYVETDISTPHLQVTKLKEVLKDKDVDGVIITPLIKSGIKELVDKYSEKVSFLMLDSYLCHGVPYIGSDYFFNAQITARFLDTVLRENEKILFFNAQDDNISSIEYYNGFKDYVSNTNKNIIFLGDITNNEEEIYEEIKPYINKEEYIGIYTPRYIDLLLNVLTKNGFNESHVKVVAQSKGKTMEEYLTNNCVIAIVEEMIDKVAYKAGKCMIEKIYNNKSLLEMKEHIKPQITIL
ncbi:MAG: LacI family DNA-binding transcriptional regulator [Lachnospirales bacterium]